MDLYSYYRSSAAYRVRIGLNLKNLAYRIIPVNLLAGEQRQPDYRAVQPQGLVPALRIDGQPLLSQSTAILEYLEAQYPQSPLLPKDNAAAARVRSWVNLIACDIHPLNNLRVLKYLKQSLAISNDQRAHWYQHWVSEGFSALETQLEADPFCHGEHITMADVYLIPQIYNALRFEIDMSGFSRIMAIYEACNQNQAFIDAQPENQPDCPPAD